MSKHNTTRVESVVAASQSWVRLSVVGAIVGLFMLSAGSISAFTPSGDAPKWAAPAAASAKKNPVAASDAAIQVGKKIFTKECVSCHGKKGVGDGPKAVDLDKKPGNLTTSDFQSQKDGALFWKITMGNKPMPSFKNAYTEEERWSLVNYLRTLSK